MQKNDILQLNRTVQPPLSAPSEINILHAAEVTLNNGLRIYVIDSGEEEVVKLELIFPSGITHSAQYTVASACHQLIDAGTAHRSAMEIAEGFDYFGAHIQTEFGPDWKSISLYTLNRFFTETLDLFDELLTGAIFPDQELATWKTRSIQSLLVNREKVSWLAKTAFNATLFGKNHPYGFTPGEDDINAVSAEALRAFYREGYPMDKVVIILSGKITGSIQSRLTEVFSKNSFTERNGHVEKIITSTTDSPVKKIIEKKDAVQSGIRIGKKMITKTHPDFPALLIANTILGGYFGSRLMSNIREDKGFTYGIGSGIHPHLQSGLFYITTEVGKQVREQAVTEIYKELRRLTTEPVPAAELELVRNYLAGSFQRSLDGPFALADRFKGIHLFGLTYDFLENYLKMLQIITPEQVMEVVSRHLEPASMSEIIVG